MVTTSGVAIGIHYRGNTRGFWGRKFPAVSSGRAPVGDQGLRPQKPEIRCACILYRTTKSTKQSNFSLLLPVYSGQWKNFLRRRGKGDVQCTHSSPLATLLVTTTCVNCNKRSLCKKNTVVAVVKVVHKTEKNRKTCVKVLKYGNVCVLWWS